MEYAIESILGMSQGLDLTSKIPQIYSSHENEK